MLEKIKKHKLITTILVLVLALTVFNLVSLSLPKTNNQVKYSSSLYSSSSSSSSSSSKASSSSFSNSDTKFEEIKAGWKEEEAQRVLNESKVLVENQKAEEQRKEQAKIAEEARLNAEEQRKEQAKIAEEARLKAENEEKARLKVLQDLETKERIKGEGEIKSREMESARIQRDNAEKAKLQKIIDIQQAQIRAESEEKTQLQIEYHRLVVKQWEELMAEFQKKQKENPTPEGAKLIEVFKTKHPDFISP